MSAYRFYPGDRVTIQSRSLTSMTGMKVEILGQVTMNANNVPGYRVLPVDRNIPAFPVYEDEVQSS